MRPQLKLPFSLLSALTFLGWGGWFLWRRFIFPEKCSGESCLGVGLGFFIYPMLWGFLGICLAVTALVVKETPRQVSLLALVLNALPYGFFVFQMLANR
jgi:hypothetical protein